MAVIINDMEVVTEAETADTASIAPVGLEGAEASDRTSIQPFELQTVLLEQMERLARIASH